MKAHNGQELAKAIMAGVPGIELDESLASGVSKILNPSEVAWSEEIFPALRQRF